VNGLAEDCTCQWETTLLLSEHKLHLLQTVKLPLTIAHLSGMINLIPFPRCAINHNFYAILNATDKFRITLGLIYGMEQKSKAAANIILYTAL